MLIRTNYGLTISLTDTRFELTNDINKSFVIIDSSESPQAEKQFKEIFLLMDAIRSLYGKN